MSDVVLGPSGVSGPFGLLRYELNRRYAAFSAQARDVDAEGRVFRCVFAILAAAMLGRALFAWWIAVPGLSHDAHALGPLALLTGLSFLAQRASLFEAALVLRTGALFALAMPWMSAISVSVFSLGRDIPLLDDWLASLDRCLGFDWLAYARWFDERPWAWTLSQLAYESVFAQFIASTLLLGFSRQAQRAYVFVTAQVLTLTTVIIVAIFVPAIGAFEQAGAAGAGLHHADFITGDTMTASIRWLRSGNFLTGGINNDHLISFPSYHASCAVFFLWAFWPFRYVRWAGVTLNMAMLAATPVQGSHYLVDVIAGAAIAAAWIGMCQVGIAWLTARVSERASPSSELATQAQ